MSIARAAAVKCQELHAAARDLRNVVLRGLSRPQKELPCSLFYDELGSELFEAITRLPEYYLTRAELAILREHGAAIAAPWGSGCVLVEYGSGSSTKVGALLEHLREPAAYLAVDVSPAALQTLLRRLAATYPGLRLIGVCADYSRLSRLPMPHGEGRRIVVFFGSTMDNLQPSEAVSFLRRAARFLRSSDGLLIGVDVKKDPRLLHAAYNDAAGVTAAFNLNILRHVNREVGADFCLERFAHRAFYNPEQGRIEMHLESLTEQTVHVAGQPIRLRAGETIHTENSYKYSAEEFRALAAEAGLTACGCWSDSEGRFSLHYLSVP